MKTLNSRMAMGWGRYSSSKQEDGDSRRRQETLNRQCAERHGIKIIGEHFDEGVSVKDGATPLFKKVIAELPKGVGIICEDLDRINRGHPWRAKAYIADILEAGHFIITSKDDREYNAETIEQLDTLVMGDMATNVARYENNKRIGRVREEKAKAIQLAREGKPAPLGAWLPSFIRYDFDTGAYLVNDEIKDTTKRIFQWYLEGKGTSHIARILNAEKVPTFGKKIVGGWTRSSISECLRYEGNIGILVHKNESIPNAFPAAISEDLFYQVQTKLKANKERHGNYTSDNVPNVLRGVSKCACCGSSVKVREREYKGKKARYYMCTGYVDRKKGSENCKNNLRAEELEYEFVKWLVPQAKDALLGRNPIKDRIETLRGKKNACNERISETMALWDKGLKLGAVEQRLFGLQDELAKTEAELNQAIAEDKSDEALPANFKQLDQLIDATLDNPEARKKVAAIVPSIVNKVAIDLRDKEQPSFTATLVNGKVITWEYVIEEYTQPIKGISKDGQFVLGKGKVIDGRYQKNG